MSYTDARLADVLAALKARGNPACPYCGAPLESASYGGAAAHWHCGTAYELPEECSRPEWLRGDVCYERQLADLRIWSAAQDACVKDQKEQLAALRAEAERLESVLRSVMRAVKVVADHIDSRAYPYLEDRLVEAYDKCDAALGRDA